MDGTVLGIDNGHYRAIRLLVEKLHESLACRKQILVPSHKTEKSASEIFRDRANS